MDHRTTMNGKVPDVDTRPPGSRNPLRIDETVDLGVSLGILVDALTDALAVKIAAIVHELNEVPTTGRLHGKSRIYNSKLTESDVREIRAEFASVDQSDPTAVRRKTSELAFKYDVSFDTIYAVRTGRTWSHVE